MSREELAKRAEAAGIPSLAAALRDGKSIQACDEISDHGWIRVGTMLPSINEKVLVTDGKNVTIGWLRSEPNFWDVFMGDYHFDRDKVIAWIYKPEPPFEDFYDV